MPWGGASALNGSAASNPTCPGCGKPVATMADSQTNILFGKMLTLFQEDRLQGSGQIEK